MPYIWRPPDPDPTGSGTASERRDNARTEQIQGYLDSESTIEVEVSGDAGNFTLVSAQLHENDAVFLIRSIMSLGWKPTSTSDSGKWETVTDTDLIRLSAKLTASNIASARTGSGIGEVPEYGELYRDAVFGQLKRIMLIGSEADDDPNTDTATGRIGFTGLMRRDPYPTAQQVLQILKRRERAVRNVATGR